MEVQQASTRVLKTNQTFASKLAHAQIFTKKNHLKTLKN
jgi:hypothetical protein